MKITKVTKKKALDVFRGVARGGSRGARGPPPPNLADQLTLRGADYAPHTTASPPEFKKLSTPLVFVEELKTMLLQK